MKNSFKKLSSSDFITSEWSGGETTQFFIFPESSSFQQRNFKARISSATVELEEATFTRLEGVHRFITPLNGNLLLTHNGKTFIDLKPFDVYEFQGGTETKSFGRVRDFNLMLANGATGELKHYHIPKQKEILITINDGLNVLYSYNNTFNILMDDKEVILFPNEIVVLPSSKLNQIQVHSSNDSNLLISRILE